MIGVLGPGLVLFLVGIPLFGVTFGGVAYLFSTPFGLVQWLIASSAGVIAALLGALAVQRLIYRFAPISHGDV